MGGDHRLLGHSFATFSIAASDPDDGSLGVAVATEFLAVGSAVAWMAGVGAEPQRLTVAPEPLSSPRSEGVSALVGPQLRTKRPSFQIFNNGGYQTYGQ